MTLTRVSGILYFLEQAIGTSQKVDLSGFISQETIISIGKLHESFQERSYNPSKLLPKLLISNY
ncbi:MAG TPA: hypothetical protein VHR84_11390 [Terriglobales bacterium]|nr:hypothetical protein [Terriglobales bacterium]